MELIKFKSDSWLSYPVGNDMESAIINSSKVFKLLLPKVKKSDTVNIWCRGSSGAIISALISSNFVLKGIPHKICHIKKPGESSHSSCITPIYKGLNIIVDDFIDSGHTITVIISEIINEYGLEVNGIALCGSINNKSFLDTINSNMFIIHQH